ncbi:MAG: universal stress protein [Chloroflexota bacterium]
MLGTLLVPLDGSEVSEASLPWAIRLAQQRGLSLTLTRVVEYPHVVNEAWEPEMVSSDLYDRALAVQREDASTYLANIRQQLAGSDVPIETRVVAGTPAVALLDLTDELGVEAVVIASHGHSGFRRLVLGSVAQQLLSHAAVPIFLVRASTPELRRPPALVRLLIPLDGSALAERATEAARQHAGPDTTLVLVRVVPWLTPTPGEGHVGKAKDTETTALRVSMATAYLDRLAAELRADGLAVETQVIVSESKTSVGDHLAIVAAAGDIDLIVMSTHGRGGVTGWLLGSVADEVVRSVDLPVLLVSARAAAAGATGNLRVGDVMTTDVLTLRDDEPLVTAMRKLVRRRASGAPVLNAEGQIVGVVSQRDILAWHERTVEALATDDRPTAETYGQQLRSEQVRAVMSDHPATIHESATVSTALSVLRERGVHRLPVTRNDKLVGIVTGSDIMLGMLAQIEAAHEHNRSEELLPTAEELAAARANT